MLAACIIYFEEKNFARKPLSSGSFFGPKTELSVTVEFTFFN